MKDRALTILSLVFAAGALAHSIWLQQHADTLASEALRRRESELVRAATPNFVTVLQNMSRPTFDAASFHPTTFEELALPLVDVITAFNTPPDPPQPQVPK